MRRPEQRKRAWEKLTKIDVITFNRIMTTTTVISREVNVPDWSDIYS